MMDDRTLESLGEYFVYHRIRENYGITFERFVDQWMRGVNIVN